MSRALPPNYLAQRLTPTSVLAPKKDSDDKRKHDSAQSPELAPRNLPSNHGSRDTTRRLSSPFDFTDSIPFSELKLSNKTLGSGSYGTVFKGRWRDRDVAVKYFKTRQEIDSFSVEVKQLSRVEHPNIVKLYGASSPSRTAAYLIMEYAEGGSLNHLLHECRQQEYDLRHACSWAMQTARGVAYLHSRPKPIMHRDLKPANLLLFSRGKTVKICDFGTACDVKTQMTNNTGSASYMAPEVFKSSSYLESADVFSWGIIFWEFLVRAQPYSNQNLNQYQILFSVTRGLRPEEIEGCPDMIWNLIKKSWHQDAEARPTMQQVAQEMELIFALSQENVSSTKSTPTVVDPGSLPQSPSEVKPPPSSNNAVSSDPSNQPHTRCGSLFSRLLAGSGQRRSSRPTEVDASKSIRSRVDSSKLVDQISKNSQKFHPSVRLHPELSSSCLDGPKIVTSGNFLQHDHRIHHLEHHNQIRHHESTGISSTHSRQQFTTTTRLKTLMRQIELLQKRQDEIRNELECDRKNSTDESFKEFSNLKSDIESLRKLVKESTQSLKSSSSYRPPQSSPPMGEP